MTSDPNFHHHNVAETAYRSMLSAICVISLLHGIAWCSEIKARSAAKLGTVVEEKDDTWEPRTSRLMDLRSAESIARASPNQKLIPADNSNLSGYSTLYKSGESVAISNIQKVIMDYRLRVCCILYDPSLQYAL